MQWLQLICNAQTWLPAIGMLNTKDELASYQMITQSHVKNVF